MKKLRTLIASFFVVSITVSALSAQSGALKSEGATARSSVGARSAASGLAEQEFRRGVQAYYRGAFNDAILQFEKALFPISSE